MVDEYMMHILLNGRPHELPADATISTLLDTLELGQRRVAVEVNEEIVPRSAHSTTQLQPADRVEVVHAIGGG